MIAARNARRRARGEPEVSAADMELRGRARARRAAASAASAIWPTVTCRSCSSSPTRDGARGGCRSAPGPTTSRRGRVAGRGRAGRRSRGRSTILHAVRTRRPTPSSNPVARCLIIACGCRGLELAQRPAPRRARGPGDARATRLVWPAWRPRESRRCSAIPTGSPHWRRRSTTSRWPTSCWAARRGPRRHCEPLHSTRLDMLLSKILDSTVRGIVYEAGRKCRCRRAGRRGGTRARVRAGLARALRAARPRSARPRGVAQRRPWRRSIRCSAAPDVVAAPRRRPVSRPARRPASIVSRRSSRSERIRAVAPQMRCSPTW